MSAGESVSYEVYKLVRGRWTMRARFGDDERQLAFDEAYAQEKTTNVAATCIIKETYRAADNAATESVIYHSPSLPEPPSVRAVTREQAAEHNVPPGVAPAAQEAPAPPPAEEPPAAQAPAPRPAALATPGAVQRTTPTSEGPVVAEPEVEVDPGPEPPEVAPQPAFTEDDAADAMVEFSIFEAVLRFFAVLFLSLLGGTLFGAVIFFLLKSGPALGLALTTDQARTIILSAGLLGALGAFFPLLRFLLPDMSLSRGNGGTGRAVAATAGVMLPGMSQQNPAFAGVPAGAGATAGASLRRQPPPPPPPARVAGFDNPEALADTAAALGLGAGQSVGGPGAATPQEAPEADEQETPPPEVAAAAPAPVPRNQPEDVAAVKEGLKSLANEAQDALQGQNGPLDPYRSFGMTLFLAGAGETLGRWHSVTQRRVAKSVAAIVEGLGASAENAAGFAYHVDEYLLDPRFQEMYAAGRSSAVHRQYDDETPSGIVEAMRDWSQPSSAAAAGTAASESGMATVMLTRVMAIHADGRGQAPVRAEFIRVHDELARDTVGRFGGREIKHTGEGMLVSFPNAAAAVEAASSMQQLFRRLRDTTPEVAPTVAIVVAAGAPIQRTSDPRRTPVRIAAALMARADLNDILVAPPVPDMMKGEMFRFERTGTFQIAGVDEPMALFRVNW